MSENLNRSHPDFSKYDSMSIGELEEVLRADAMGPERDDPDVDEILYVMEVLAKKRRQNGIAGKTALEAYQEFQQHDLPTAEEKPEPSRRATVIPFRRFAAVAASLVLVFTLATTANAFSFRDVWDAVVTWAQETFSFSMGVEVREPSTTENTKYSSLRDALEKDGRDSSIIPSFIPNEYTLKEIIVDRNPKQDTYLAVYTNGGIPLRITVQCFLNNYPEQLEKSDSQYELYTSNGYNYYIFENNQTLQAVWIVDFYECCISGNLSVDDLQTMIDSIGKGT